MFGPVVVHVAALAEGREVLGPIVRRVVIPMPGGQDHPGGPHTPKNIIGPDREADEASGSIAPGAFRSIPPATIAEMEHALPMRTGADLAAPLRPLEADHGREFAPVDGIEEAVLASDRHARQSCRAVTTVAAAAAWLRARAWGK